jgi:hypothetical protein
LVVDPGLRADPVWLWPGETPVPVVFCTEAAARSRGAGRAEELVALPEPAPGAGLDVEHLVATLPALDIWSVLVEGGGDTQRRFLMAGLWDRLWRYRNPRLRLSGKPWSAAAAWNAAWKAANAANATNAANAANAASATPSPSPSQRLELGDDRLDVFVHPATRLAG